MNSHFHLALAAGAAPQTGVCVCRYAVYRSASIPDWFNCALAEPLKTKAERRLGRLLHPGEESAQAK